MKFQTKMNVMKKTTKFVVLTFAILYCSNSILAQTHDTIGQKFKYRGIFYKITDTANTNATVAVTFKPSSTYSGSIEIPDTVKHKHKHRYTTYTVTAIDTMAFYACIGLTSVTIPKTVKKIDSAAFAYCVELDSITFQGDTFAYISERAFYACINLTAISFPKIDTIGDYAFSKCYALSEIKMENSLTSIGKYAFKDCNQLDTIKVFATIPLDIDSLSFDSEHHSRTTVKVPCGSLSNYRADSLWKKFIHLHTIYSYDTSFHDTICYGGTYNANGFNINATKDSVYIKRDTTICGCDSISVLHLTIDTKPISIFDTAVFICKDSFYSDSNFKNFNGLNTENKYYDTLPNMNGCDSVVAILYLYHYPNVFTYCSASICKNGSYPFKDDSLTYPGVYYDTVKVGCYDSIIVLTLTVDSVYFTQISDTICQGTTYNFFGKPINTDATEICLEPLHTYTVGGCDSVIQLALTVIPLPHVELCRVTVDTNNHNVIFWDTSQVGKIDSIKIFRENAHTGVYDSVATVSYKHSCWVESNNDLDSSSYKIISIDTCGCQSDTSEVHSTMYLKVEADYNKNIRNLHWTKYKGRNYLTYYIYRTRSNGEDELIGTMPYGTEDFTDLFPPQDSVWYRVEIEGACCDSCKIRSNIAFPLDNTRIAEIIDISHFTIYPNPTNGILRIVRKNIPVPSDEWQVKIFDMMGKNLQIESRKQNGEDVLIIDISHLATGVYVLQVDGQRVKVVKQ